MSVTRGAMEDMVMHELQLLHNDQSTLEHLYARLPDISEPNVQVKFFSLWADVEKRADRLEHMLDRMA